MKRKGWRNTPYRDSTALGAPEVVVTVLEVEPFVYLDEQGRTIKRYPPGYAEGVTPQRSAQAIGLPTDVDDD